MPGDDAERAAGDQHDPRRPAEGFQGVEDGPYGGGPGPVTQLAQRRPPLRLGGLPRCTRRVRVGRLAGPVGGGGEVTLQLVAAGRAAAAVRARPVPCRRGAGPARAPGCGAEALAGYQVDQRVGPRGGQRGGQLGDVRSAEQLPRAGAVSHPQREERLASQAARQLSAGGRGRHHGRSPWPESTPPSAGCPSPASPSTRSPSRGPRWSGCRGACARHRSARSKWPRSASSRGTPCAAAAVWSTRARPSSSDSTASAGRRSSAHRRASHSTCRSRPGPPTGRARRRVGGGHRRPSAPVPRGGCPGSPSGPRSRAGHRSPRSSSGPWTAP